MSGLVRKTTLCALSLLAVAGAGRAQTCSCARAPVGSSLEGPSIAAGSWQFGLTYEYHPISDVYAGTEEVQADNRKRTSHTGLFEATLGLTDRVSVTGQLTLTQQERRSTSTVGSGEFLRTRGVGDGLFLIRYNLLLPTGGKRLQISAGGGIKVPFGTSSLSNNGTLISADMQPGSGSWDGLLWGYFNQNLEADFSTALFGSASYRINGSADRGGSFPAGYRVGNELVSNLGISVRQSSLLDIIMGIRIRNASRDRAGGQDVPNTGGFWINLAPATNLNLSPTLTVRLGGQVPVYRDVEGLQATTSYTLSIALFYTLTGGGKFGIQP